MVVVVDVAAASVVEVAGVVDDVDDVDAVDEGAEVAVVEPEAGALSLARGCASSSSPVQATSEAVSAATRSVRRTTIGP